MFWKKKTDDEIINELENQLLEEQAKTEKALEIAEKKKKIKELKEKRKKAKNNNLGKIAKGAENYFSGISKNFR